MPKITIKLPDAVHRAALEAGLHISDICRRALENEMTALAARAPATLEAGSPDEGREDDHARYRRGRSLGRIWARETALLEEMVEVVRLGDHRWRQVPLDPACHSLPLAYCRANGLDEPIAGDLFWLERDPYTMGLVDGVTDIYAKVVAPA